MFGWTAVIWVLDDIFVINFGKQELYRKKSVIKNKLKVTELLNV